MIVRNEEEVIKRSLQSICFRVPEIIVVDTGSTDRTKQIAQDYTEKVYTFDWCNDFSMARNFSLEKATNDWVLVLDADEIITSFNINQIESVLARGDDIVGRIKLVNIIADEAGDKRQIERVSRLFNRSHFLFEGTIHEQLVKNDQRPYVTVPVDITVDHIGYTQEVLKRTNKIARNISLLEQALNHSPNDSYLLYQLGKAYYVAKNLQKAVEYFQRALNLTVNYTLEYVENLIETYGYALINSGRFSEACGLKNYARHYANSPDYLFLMGHIYMNNGMFSQAIQSFAKCVGKKEGKVQGVNSYLPNYNIGVIFECIGKIEQAKYYYSQCGQYPLALNRLKLLNR
jgi:Glycosyltransferases involved in cell wall biogenesis